MAHAPVPESQHAPISTAQFLGEQTMPRPRKVSPCCWQAYSVLITHAARASLQQPPLAHGLGRQAADAYHVPAQLASVETEQTLAIEQHAPVVAQGVGEQLAA